MSKQWSRWHLPLEQAHACYKITAFYDEEGIDHTNYFPSLCKTDNINFWKSEIRTRIPFNQLSWLSSFQTRLESIILMNQLNEKKSKSKKNSGLGIQSSTWNPILMWTWTVMETWKDPNDNHVYTQILWLDKFHIFIHQTSLSSFSFKFHFVPDGSVL